MSNIKTSIIDKLIKKFQIKIRDRKASAIILSSLILNYLGNYKRKDIFVLGIPKGGVIVADIIANRLEASYFDIVLSRKLLIPFNQENGFGSVMEDESVYIDFRVVERLSISPEYIEKEKLHQIQEMKHKSLLYRKSGDLLQYNKKLNDKNRIIILVDDGVATGATLISVARWIKNRTEHKYKKLIIAIPIAPKHIVELLKKECDHVEVVLSPSDFQTVSHFYRDFEQITDEQVMKILENWRQ
jgi:predicted phosphoribosyltransferase